MASMLHGHGSLVAYRVSDTYQIRIRIGYVMDTYPGRIHELGRIGPENLKLDTYLVYQIRPSFQPT